MPPNAPTPPKQDAKQDRAKSESSVESIPPKPERAKPESQPKPESQAKPDAPTRLEAVARPEPAKPESTAKAEPAAKPDSVLKPDFVAKSESAKPEFTAQPAPAPKRESAAKRDFAGSEPAAETEFVTAPAALWLRLTAAANSPATETEFANPADKAASPVPALRRRAVAWYVLGLAALGAAVGVLAGLSENPVVGALLPVLGGLMMAGASFYLAKASLFKEENLEKLRVIGVATGFFAISVIVGTVYGVSIRGGFSFADFVPRWSANAPPALPGNDEAGFAQATRLLALRSRLQLLGATDDEVRQILTLASATLKQERQEGVRPVLVQAFARETRQIQTDVRTLLTRMPEKPSEDAEEDWFALQAMALRIERTLPTIDALEKRSGALSVSDTDLLFTIAEQLKRGLRDIRGSRIVRAAAHATGVNVARFDVWAESLNALTRPPEAQGASSFDRMVNDVDGLVGTASGKVDNSAAQRRARPQPKGP